MKPLTQTQHEVVALMREGYDLCTEGGRAWLQQGRTGSRRTVTYTTWRGLLARRAIRRASLREWQPGHAHRWELDPRSGL